MTTVNKDTIIRPEFAITKIVQEGENGYDRVFLEFETHKLLSKNDKITEAQGLPYRKLRTSRGNDARLWKFKAANGEVCEVITETVPVKNDFPQYAHFVKHDDVPTFLDNVDENGEEMEVVTL